MSTRNIRVPDIGEGVTEAEIVEWQVAVGDAVAEDQILGAVMTDKAAVDIPSPVGGVIVSLGGVIGDVLAVGAELIRIEVGGQDKYEDDSHSSTDQESGSIDTVNKENKETTAGSHHQDDVAFGDELHSMALAAPAVRWRARERGVALRDVKASAVDGRITHTDLDNYLLDTAVISPRSAKPVDTVEEVHVVGVRRQIARQMELASRRISHFSYIEELDVTELESLRHALAETGDDDIATLTPLPFIVMAIVRSLEKFPAMNARYDDEAGIVRVHSGRHVGIATHTEKGLMVPVVRHAELFDVHELSTEITRLAMAARNGRIAREELEGGTITVTSLGAHGGLASTPIINHPEVAIVGVNRIITRVVCRDEQIVKRRMMNLSSSFDHRVVDGHDAAHFIQSVRAYVECPATLFIRD
jgi:2-oxoisovalerate dehydrogenase E2 component (dihydrolipoyl transacylase)